MGEKWWMNVEIKRFSDSGEDSTKATECHKIAVWSKSYVTIPLLFHFPKWLDEDAGINRAYQEVCDADSYVTVLHGMDMNLSEEAETNAEDEPTDICKVFEGVLHLGV